MTSPSRAIPLIVRSSFFLETYQAAKEIVTAVAKVKKEARKGAATRW
jgi:hypothetical protein